ncbi:MAG: DUF4339 domain-containing protein [Gammaproteobacteria bacterium]|nr:DUF4339 domain-containing protein [Gammaproteobacteria bacterium]
MQGKSWYFRRKGRVEGPFSLEQLQKRVGTDPEYSVWNSKLASWKPAGDWLQNFGNESATVAESNVKSLKPSAKIVSRSEAVESQHTDSKIKQVKEHTTNQSPSLENTSKDNSLVADKATASRFSDTAADLKVFREKWAALEKKQLSERQALLQEFSELKQQISTIKRASIESTLAHMSNAKSEQESLVKANADKSVSQSKPAHSNTILRSQNLKIDRSTSEETHQSTKLELVNDQQYVKHEMNSGGDAQEKIYPWPNPQGQKTRTEPTFSESLTESNSELSEDTVNDMNEQQIQLEDIVANSSEQLGDNDKISDIEMMRRVVARRRRRRAR